MSHRCTGRSAEPPGQRDDAVGVFGPEFQNMTEVPRPAPVLRPEQRRVGVGVVGFRHLGQPFGFDFPTVDAGAGLRDTHKNRWKGSVCSWAEHSRRAGSCKKINSDFNEIGIFRHGKRGAYVYAFPMKSTPRSWPEEVRQAARSLYLRRSTVGEVSTTLGVPVRTLYQLGRGRALG